MARTIALNRVDLIFWALAGLILLAFVLDAVGTRILFNGDASAASFLLSAIPQSLAALFAITFSVLLIALEFSASKYTPKVLRFFLESIFTDLQIVAVIGFFVITMFVEFVTLAHISGTSVPNELRVLTSLSIALTAWCFLLIINLFRRVPRFFSPADLLRNLKAKVIAEDRPQENAELVKILGDIVKKETIQGNVDVARDAVAVIEVTALYNVHHEREGLNEEVLEQLFEICRTAIRVDDAIMGSEVAKVVGTICRAAIDEDSRYLGGLRYLREIGMLALDPVRGIVHSPLLLSVSHLFGDLIRHARDAERSLHTLFAIMQFLILGSFYNANHESVANHVIEDITSVCSKAEVTVAYNGLMEKKEALKAYFGGKDPEEAIKEFYNVLMAY
ncbi:MAG: DUF2254 domain-containing protein [Euryarchaeota archaeon]|nr:DUF2254 domain-containing protein [Euryarchaeota archaeon]